MTVTKKIPASKGAGFLNKIKTTGSGLKPRICVAGVEGIGKSSFPVWAKNPIFLMSQGETGIETLIDAGQIPAVSNIEITTWSDLVNTLDELIGSEHDFETVVLDTINGFERLLYDHICHTQYGGDWGPRGFANFQQGYITSSVEFEKMLSQLERLRNEKNMMVFLLSHIQVKVFRNPAGADYARFSADMHKNQWGLLHRWCDIVMFFDFVTVVDEDGSRNKGKGGTKRIAYTQRRAAWDAKNRHGLPESFSLGATAEEGWNNFVNAMKKGN